MEKTVCRARWVMGSALLQGPCAVGLQPYETGGQCLLWPVGRRTGWLLSQCGRGVGGGAQGQGLPMLLVAGGCTLGPAGWHEVPPLFSTSLLTCFAVFPTLAVPLSPFAPTHAECGPAQQPPRGLGRPYFLLYLLPCPQRRLQSHRQALAAVQPRRPRDGGGGGGRWQADRQQEPRRKELQQLCLRECRQAGQGPRAAVRDAEAHAQADQRGEGGQGRQGAGEGGKRLQASQGRHRWVAPVLPAQRARVWVGCCWPHAAGMAGASGPPAGVAHMPGGWQRGAAQPWVGTLVALNLVAPATATASAAEDGSGWKGTSPPSSDEDEGSVTGVSWRWWCCGAAAAAVLAAAAAADSASCRRISRCCQCCWLLLLPLPPATELPATRCLTHLHPPLPPGPPHWCRRGVARPAAPRHIRD